MAAKRKCSGKSVWAPAPVIRPCSGMKLALPLSQFEVESHDDDKTSVADSCTSDTE